MYEPTTQHMIDTIRGCIAYNVGIDHDFMAEVAGMLEKIDNENKWLRCLVKDAYIEGYWDGQDGARIPNAANEGWERATTRQKVK